MAMIEVNYQVRHFADVMIDLAVVWLLILNFRPKLCKNEEKMEDLKQN